MWRLLIAAALINCGRDDRLVDRPTRELEELCTSHPMAVEKYCEPGDFGCSTTLCSFLRSNLTCADLINRLPGDCNATPADYLACQAATCATFKASCAAFAMCGIEVWQIACSSCG